MSILSLKGEKMVLREQDKHFLWSLYVAVGVILVWKGIWEGMYSVPELLGLPESVSNPFVFLFIGFAMLTFSGIIFKEFDPLGSLDKTTLKMMHFVQSHPQKDEFVIKYQDKERKKEVGVKGERLKEIEKGALVVKHPEKKQEVFVPLHRVTEVWHRGKLYWKL